MQLDRPQHPIYVISKGRAATCLTAKFLLQDKVSFRLVVEPQEVDDYARHVPRELILTLPFANLGLGSIPARNWVWEHSKERGNERHWILDDNIRNINRWHRGVRIRANANVAFKVCEDFTERYENIAISGMNYSMFGVPSSNGQPPFYLNNHVYSCLLILNSLPHRWRGRYNEDTDLCLQVLADGWCTVLFNIFLIVKMPSMTMTGGNTDQLYSGDGRLKMARSLERLWPGVVSVDRRFRRPQHVVKDQWRRFDTPLKLKPGIDLTNMKPNEYGMKLVEKAPVKSDELKRFAADFNSKKKP